MINPYIQALSAVVGVMSKAGSQGRKEYEARKRRETELAGARALQYGANPAALGQVTGAEPAMTPKPDYLGDLASGILGAAGSYMDQNKVGQNKGIGSDEIDEDFETKKGPNSGVSLAYKDFF